MANSASLVARLKTWTVIRQEDVIREALSVIRTDYGLRITKELAIGHQLEAISSSIW